MPTVPKYEPSVRLAPLNQEGFSVRSSADDFGAAIGRGMGDLASGLTKVADAKTFVQELEGEAAAKDRDNKTAAELRELKYGANGYLNLEGQAAVAARAEYERKAAEIIKRNGEGMTGFGAKAYQRASETRLQSFLDETITHQSRERKTWMKQASADRLTTFADDALADYQNPGKVAGHIDAGLAEIRSMGVLSGLDEDSLSQREAEFVSGVHKSIALRMAQTDPAAAKEYADAHKDELGGTAMADLEGIFAPIILDQQARGKADEYLNPSAPSPNQFAATDLPPQAYTILSVIAGSESPGYDVKNGGERFDGYGAHPNSVGAGGTSTAAGRYQFVFGTWVRASKAIGAADFTPENQDRGAWWLAQADYKANTGRDLMADISAGNYDMIKAGLGSTWEGLAKMDSAEFAKRMQLSGSGAPMDPLTFLDGIENPALRDATERRIAAVTAMRERDAKAAREALKANAFSAIDGGQSPDSLSPEMRAQLGREEMNGLWSYYTARNKPGGIKTDEQTLYELQTEYATDPVAFSQKDLFSVRDKLSDSDWEKVNGWRQTALTDQRKAREEGASISSVKEEMNTRLTALGITTTDKKGAEREAAARREAQFQLALQQEVETWAKSNGGVQPGPEELRKIIDRLLLPVVIKANDGWFGAETRTPALGFEVPKLGDIGGGKVAEVFEPYESIPPSIRTQIEMEIEQKQGFIATPEQVELAYAQYLSAQINTGP